MELDVKIIKNRLVKVVILGDFFLKLAFNFHLCSRCWYSLSLSNKKPV